MYIYTDPCMDRWIGIQTGSRRHRSEYTAGTSSGIWIAWNARYTNRLCAAAAAAAAGPPAACSRCGCGPAGGAAVVAASALAARRAKLKLPMISTARCDSVAERRAAPAV
jgi:hypothetical protein